jgi:hypothetical protein
MRLTILSLISVVVLALAGCPTTPAEGNAVYGLVFGFQWGITSPVTVKLSHGAKTYTAQADVYTSSDQYGSFLMENVPSGTYTLTLTINASAGSSGTPQYSLDGVAWTPYDSWTGTGAPWTITFNGIAIGDTTDISVDLGNGNS